MRLRPGTGDFSSFGRLLVVARFSSFGRLLGFGDFSSFSRLLVFARFSSFGWLLDFGDFSSYVNQVARNRPASLSSPSNLQLYFWVEKNLYNEGMNNGTVTLGNLSNVSFSELKIDNAGLVIGEGHSNEGDFTLCFRVSAGATRMEIWDYLGEAWEGLICDMVGEV